jgi:plastocyanin
MKKLAALLVLALVSAAFTACGGSDTTATTANGGEANGEAATAGGEKTSGGGSVVELAADPTGKLAYTTTEASAKAGEVTIDFKNPQGLPHDVELADTSGKIVGETPRVTRDSTSIAVNLKPGTYTYYCTVPGHREAGMEGTLTVK